MTRKNPASVAVRLRVSVRPGNVQADPQVTHFFVDQPLPMPDRPSFQQCVLASGLLTQGADRRGLGGPALGGGRHRNGKAPAQRSGTCRPAGRSGLLNAWQAQQLLEGRTSSPSGRTGSSIRSARGHGPGLQGGSRGWAAPWPSKCCRATNPPPRPSPISHAKSSRWPSWIIANLVRALDAGHEGNVYYLVTEYVPGADFRKLVRAAVRWAWRPPPASFRKWLRGCNTPTTKG